MEEERKQEEIQEEQKEESAKEEKPLDKMTVIELREIAHDIPSIAGAHAMKKEALLPLIKEARGLPQEKPETKKKRAKKGGSVKQLKQKIILVKEEKEAARSEKDRKKVTIHRRRINRLKKQIRKTAQA